MLDLLSENFIGQDLIKGQNFINFDEYALDLKGFFWSCTFNHDRINENLMHSDLFIFLQV